MSEINKDHRRLADLNLPTDIRELSTDQLELLSYELREIIIDRVSKNGGHLASNLGIVELTLSILRVFDVSKSPVIFDVGHQAYVYKLLTGRLEKFSSLRQMGGMSGFPKRTESEFDYFDSGHASSSISVALGIATGKAMSGDDAHTLAIIGDGAMTGGMFYEALLNAASLGSKLLIIINDNEKSIEDNIKSMNHHLSNLRASKKYRSIKENIKYNLEKLSYFGISLSHGIENIKNILKYSLVNGSIFEGLGVNYYGPIDGHNIEELTDILTSLTQINGPVVLHVVTKKGRGYVNAEKNPSSFHGVSPFDVQTGKPLKEKGKGFSQVIGDFLLAHREDTKICAITAAMGDSTGLLEFSKQCPDRYFDVGIAEEHAITFASGLAISGKKPYVCIYSTFLQRAYDQIISDVAIQKQPVTFIIDRAGLVGEDGETHHGIFDIAYMRTVPSMIIMAPSHTMDYRRMLEQQYMSDSKQPAAIRIARSASYEEILSKYAEIYDDLGLGEVARLTANKDASLEIWALGPCVGNALLASKLLAKKGIVADVVDVRYIRPFDEESLKKSLDRVKLIVTVEDGVLTGGLSELVAGQLVKFSNCRLLSLGYDDFIPHGSIGELYRYAKIDAEGIAEQILEVLKGE